MADHKQGKWEHSGFVVNFICMLWIQMYAIWLAHNELQHGQTGGDKIWRFKELVNPQICAAYSTSHTLVSLFDQRLCCLDLGSRLAMHPRENIW